MLKNEAHSMLIPFIQGGMGVAVSLGSLAGAVMKEGGMGVISAAQPGFRDPDFAKHPLESNLDAIKGEAEKARSIAGENGMLGLNIMHACSHYEEYCRQAERCGYDAIISGAGLPLDLPAYVSSRMLIAPIVSSARALGLIVRVWNKRYGRLPDFVVVEGPKAGGHLGFSKEDLRNNTCQPLEEIVAEIREQFPDLPVFAAGGIFDHEDYLRAIKAGACGVQAATRLIATKECDAPDEFKQVLIEAQQEDLKIIDSPAGLPARAICTPFVKERHEKKQTSVCTGCLKQCAHKDAVYCISEALMQSAQGNLQEGLFFSGANAGRVSRIETVKEVVEDIIYG